MQITLSAVGHMKRGAMMDLLTDYTKRLTWKLSIKEVEAKPGLSGRALKDAEGLLLLKTIPEGAYVVALDEKGREMASEQFAESLQGIQAHHKGKICFVIGGANGLSDEVKKCSHLILSFGRVTWPHMMVRMMLCEQIYRAQQILKGHPYHRP